MPRNANQSKQSNYSMNFNGVANEYIVSSLDGTGGSSSSFGSGSDLNLTISFWFKLSQLTTSFGMLSWATSPAAGGGLLLLVQQTSNGTVQVYIVANGAGYRYVSSTLTVDTWYNLTFTRTAADNTWRFYLNSVLDSTTYVDNGSVSGQSSATNFYIGSGYGGSGNFNGQITEVSIFNHALSPSQVTTLYGTGSAIGNPMALPSPPIAYYPLGGSAGAFQTPVNNNDKWLIENNAIGDYVFDFDSDFVTLNSSINLTGNKTVSYWVNPDSLNGNVYIGGVSPNYYTYMTSTSLAIKDSTGFSTFSINISTGNWYHICITGDGTSATLYINGSPISTTDDRNPTIDTIGAYNGGGGAINAKMSNVQIFNTALTGTEIETLYNNGSPIQTLASIPQSSNLKAWYKLDASEVYNSSTTEWSIDNNQNPSAYSSSLDFDRGSSDSIDVNMDLSSFSSITVSTWVKFTSTTGYQYVYSAGTGSVAGDILGIGKWTGTTEIYSFDRANANRTGVSVTLNTWNHILVTHTGTTRKVYLNGSLIATFTSGNLNLNSINVIGRYSFSASNYMDGFISNVSVWNTALTLAQVSELYNNGTPSNLSSHSATSNLVSWWKLNNTTTGIEDAKGSNNGTNNGATEYPGFVNTLAGDSSGMSQANLVQSDLQTVAPYSKYAMNFDSADSDNIIVNSNTGLNFGTGDFTYSLWGKINTTTSNPAFYGGGSGSNNPAANSGYLSIGVHTSQPTGYVGATRCWISGEVFNGTTIITDDNWHNIVLTRTSGVVQIYVDGNIEVMRDSSGNVVSNPTSSNSITNTNGISIGSFRTNANYINGSMSNASIWNAALTSAQVTEIYNQGLPSNLNSHSAYSNLVSWWQLGENSSYTGDWIFADEKGTNNGEGQNLTEINLTNGVGTTANGVSTGMSEGNLVGDAPYSTANALSSGMSVVSRVTGSGNTP